MHHKYECPHCGDKWKPKWLIQNFTKYNSIHKDKPKPAVINDDPPFRIHHTRSYKSKSKGVVDKGQITEMEEKSGDEDNQDSMIWWLRTLEK